jgi:hypothetical protein
MEKNPVHENGEKTGILSPKNAGTWRKSCGIPDTPADYIGGQTRADFIKVCMSLQSLRLEDFLQTFFHEMQF